jgi:hypothetical protein
MITTTHHEPGRACPSHLQLDRLSAGDLSDVERVRLERHVATCGTCMRDLAERAAERAGFVPEPRVLARLAAAVPASSIGRMRRRVAAVVAPAILCAAGVLIMVRERPAEPPAIGRRATAKGGFAARLIIERAGELVDAAARPTEGAAHQVQAGDRVQIAISLPGDRFVAAYSRDSAGAVSRYAPIDAPMIAIGPGGDQLLPNSTILDAVLGRETIAVFACARDQADAVLRIHVVSGAIPGCDVARIALVKVAP